MQAKTKRWIKRTLIVGSLALVLGAGLTVYLLHRPPAVWREAQALLDQTTATQRAELAEGVMQRLSTAADRLRADLDPVFGVGSKADPVSFSTLLASQSVDETFEVELSNQELLSVASEWTGKWFAQRGFEPPQQMSQPVVMIQGGELMIAFKLAVGSWEQVFSGRLTMRFEAHGMAYGSVTQLTAGSLPMSVATVGDWVAKQLPSSQASLAEKMGRWIAELEGFEFRPVLELEHRRRARVIAMQRNKESLVMTMRLQDHSTYKKHNALMKSGKLAVNDALPPALLDGSAIADVPTTTD
mgnify:CR=1 FL=1